MNCDKCGFYCYYDEYICPNCEMLLKREYPIDEYAKIIFINNKIIEFNKTKRNLNILRLGKIFFIITFIMQIIWGIWIHSFVINRLPKINYDIASYSIVFAIALYIIILGKPELQSDKEYVEIRKPKGLINKSKIKKSIYLSIILIIFAINYLIYFKYLKNLFINDIVARKSIKLEVFGIDKLEKIFGIRFLIHNIGVGLFYTIHSIFDITNADYYILARRDFHRKN